MKVLILCTGNSCRSQMAHGFLHSYAPNMIVRSAGTQPSGAINPLAIKVMSEVGIDISTHTSDHVDRYSNEPWDYVITVCGGANESCPTFGQRVKHRLHIGFDDPSDAVGSEGYILGEFRRVRDEIKERFYRLYVDEILSGESCPCGANSFCKCQ